MNDHPKAGPRTSKQLQIGKAGEHMVCANLLLQGYHASLADQGMPYDVLVDVGDRVLRVQVKSTSIINSYGKSKNVYRFGLRHARRGLRRAATGEVDVYAFVALDRNLIGYIPERDMHSRSGGGIKMLIELRTRSIEYKGRVYSNGTVRSLEWHQFIEDFKEFVW